MRETTWERKGVWTFWQDDFPQLCGILIGWPLAVLFVRWLFHLS